MENVTMLEAIRSARVRAGALLTTLNETETFNKGLGKMEGLIRQHWDDNTVIKVNNEAWAERISVSILNNVGLVEILITKDDKWEVLPSKVID